MTIDLTGRTVLVTGASRGIGRAIAERMAEAGASVAVHYREHRDAAERLAQQLGRSAHVFQAELADAQACDGLFREVVDVYGRLDVLVNNAAVSGYIPLDAPIEEWQREWDRTIAVNLRAVDQLCRLAIAHFRMYGVGRIINVASRAAFRGDVPDYMAYAASKGGMVALTRSIARGFGKEGVRAFTLAPGFTRTGMADEYIRSFGEDHLLRDIALDRLTEPDDIAPFAVFLASGLADHATGCTIDINAASYVH